MKLKIKKLHPDAIIPTYGSAGAACFDLCSLNGDSLGESFPTATVRTGLAFEVPEGYALMIYSRSGHGFKFDVRLSNCVGVIDSDYRGEVMVKLSYDHAAGFNTFLIRPGDRIAQAMLVPVERIEFIEVDGLSDTARGTGGFGSTGA